MKSALNNICVNRMTLMTVFSIVALLTGLSSAMAQSRLPLEDLSAFKNPAPNWRIVGDVMADLNKANTIKSVAGKGILLNVPDPENYDNLVSENEYSDLDLELDYLLSKSSNSGIYLQGRYEVQLFDSWGIEHPGSGDNGGIYERWDEQRSIGDYGYDGHSPRQNVSRAPGLWQHLVISFQAPRFDKTGRKIENAVMLKIELNGVVIQDHVELLGPTRGAIGEDEVAKGPLLFQYHGDALAFRNIVIRSYDKPRPELSELKYRVYPGRYEVKPDLSKITSTSAGATEILTSAVTNIENDFLIKYTGALDVKTPGEYYFRMSPFGGTGSLRINNKEEIAFMEFESKPVLLQAGKNTIELIYTKFRQWQKPSIALYISSEGIREFLISDPSTLNDETINPIFVEAPAQTILRSFMDMPDGRRVVHAINVGSPKQLHYTYDQESGMILQAWRGGFLDATSMWYSRGDGNTIPVGSLLYFEGSAFPLQRLESLQQPWNKDTTGSGFRPKGYELDKQDRPVFKYKIYGAGVSDAVHASDDGLELQRTIGVENPPAGLYARLATSKTIETVSNELFLVNDKSYYIRIDEAGGGAPVVREINGRKELIVPVRSTIRYSIIF